VPRVNFFAIPADDPARAIAFYTNVFGWRSELGWEYDTPRGREGYRHVRTQNGEEPGIDGGLTKREFPGQPIGVGIDVPSIDEWSARVEARGGSILVGKSLIPDVGWIAVCQDLEGNSFALFQKLRD
jgi:predicted enzyme related to lactoylglutathione lyase